MGTFLQPADLPGIPVEQALMLITEVEGAAFDAAPCLADTISLTTTERAKVVLVRAAMRWAALGFGGVRSQSVGQYQVTFDGSRAGELTRGEVTTLRRLCGASETTGGPVGHFPPAGRYDYLFGRPPAATPPNA